MAINVKDAVNIAMMHFKELFPSNLEDVALEEVEFLSTDNTWRVTIGYNRPDPTGLRLITGQPIPRVYKVVSIDADNGQPFSIKLREATA